MVSMRSNSNCGCCSVYSWLNSHHCISFNVWHAWASTPLSHKTCKNLWLSFQTTFFLPLSYTNPPPPLHPYNKWTYEWVSEWVFSFSCGFTYCCHCLSNYIGTHDASCLMKLLIWGTFQKIFFGNGLIKIGC